MGQKSTWSDWQKEYLLEHYKKETYDQISSVIGKTPKQIQTKLRLLGLSKRVDDWWSDEQIDFLINHYTEMTYKDIGNVIQKSRSAVQVKTRRLGLKKSSHPTIKKHFDEDYFMSIDNENKAYWLGFISADGCIYNNEHGTYGFKLELQSSDDDTLKRFIQDIQGDFPVLYSSHFDNNIGREYSTARVSFKNKKFVQQLLKYMAYRKTYTIRLPKDIPQELIRDYIRGYSDGDGCFYCGNRSNRKSYEIVCNTKLMLEDIQFELQKNGIASKIYSKQDGNYKLGIYSFSDIQKLVSYLYDGATIFMQRKYSKAQEILKMPSH